MPGRNEARVRVINQNTIHQEFINKRNRIKIGQFTTPELQYPTDEQLSDLELQPHIWSVGDRFYKLADQHYDDPTLWWVIALINKTPTESHMRLGELLYIPLPLYNVLNMLGY